MKQKHLIVRIILTVIVAILMLFGIGYIINNAEKEYYSVEKTGISNESVVGEIIEGTEVRQEIVPDSNFFGVQILFATYANNNLNSNYNIKVLDENKKVIYDKNVNAKKFSDNSYYSIVLDENYGNNKKVEVVITSSDAINGNALTIWKSEKDYYTDGDLYINGEKNTGDIVFNVISQVEVDDNIGIVIYRILFLTILIILLLLHIWLDVKKMYQFIFKYRVIIAFAVFAFMLVNKLHFSSIGMYDLYVQNGKGSEFIEPIFGKARSIRSDEWLVGTPRKLTTSFEGVTGKNGIPMALEVNSLTATGVELNLAALASPLYWGYLTGSAEFGISFYWSGFLIFAFMFSFEMCLILSKNKKLLSLIGACLITFSSYYLWWSGAANWLIPGQAAIVFLNYAINAKKKWSKLLYGIGVAISGASFIIILYPAWQVPAGYMLMILLVWLIVKSWDTIKKFDKKDWTIIAGCIIFMAAMVVSYFVANSEYTAIITQTVYPGERVSNGGNTISKLFNYIGGWLFGIREIANPSEAGIVLNLYPLPIIMGIIYMIKNKKADGLIISMIALSVFLSFYCSTGIPMWLSKITLMSNSIAVRAVDVLAVIQLYLFIIIAGQIEDKDKLKRIPVFIITFIVVLGGAYIFNKTMPVYFNKYELLAISVGLSICVTPWLSKSKACEKIITAAIICLVTTVTGFKVLPVMKGLDVIYSKPVAQEISDIVKEDEDAKWICINSIVASGYTISCGAPTINSTNYIPNYELWKILDEDGKYDEYYNRYAHMDIVLTEGETTVKLIQADYILVSLSYDDLEKIDVKYIYAWEPVQSGGSVELKEIYNEYGSYIYEVIYN